MPATLNIAVVGAGMAGAAAAHRLTAAGCDVVLFDKGGDVGGRMATRRTPGGLSFDHGTQYFTGHGSGFAAAVAGWTAGGAAVAWGEAGWSVGAPAMTAPVRTLLAGLAVISGCTVERIMQDERSWRLVEAADRPLVGRFDVVLVTAPVPQARTLVEAAGLDRPALRSLDRVAYAPCWTLTLAHTGEPVFEATHRRERDPDAAIAWIARDGTKPGRANSAANAAETLVVHAAPGWSRYHLEREPAEIVDLLKADLRRALGRAAPNDERCVYTAAHRWRYAMVEGCLGEPYLWSARLRLGLAGDGCLGDRVEAAYASGIALAEQVLETMQ